MANDPTVLPQLLQCVPRLELERLARKLDGSLIDLSMASVSWADIAPEMAAINLHLGLDPVQMLPGMGDRSGSPHGGNAWLPLTGSHNDRTSLGILRRLWQATVVAGFERDWLAAKGLKKQNTREDGFEWVDVSER